MRIIAFTALLAIAAPAAAQHEHQSPAAAPAQAPEHASTADRTAVLAVVDRLFATLETKDRAAMLAAVVPEGRATAAFTAPSGERRVRGASWTEFADNLLKAKEQMRERLIEPHVHVEGDIAMIWSRYEFERDGKFSHCGIDHFDLVRLNGEWRVLNLTWTQQTQGCPAR